MKRVGVISTAILLLLLGTTAPAYAQHEQKGKEQGKSQGGQQHQQAKPAQQQHSQQAGRPAQQQHQQSAQRRQPAQRQQSAQRQQPAQRQHTAQRQVTPQRSSGGFYRSGTPQYQQHVHSGFGQARARSWDRDHRSWVQRGGYVGYRVPQDRYNLYFGSGHYFRMYGLPMEFIGGYPRFLYNGYGVTFVDPWPEMWPVTWYQTDDVYLNYNDGGYYLYNRMRPGPGIAVTLSFQ